MPFQAPTSKLPTDADADVSSSTTTPAPATKEPRQHDKDRMSSWKEHARSTHGRLPDSDDESPKKNNDKVYLSPAQKKKIAFINQEFHSTADTINAYIVFAYPVPVLPDAVRKNLPPPKEVMDPLEAAKKAKEAGDGTTFMGRVIRVDLVGATGGKSEKGTSTGADVGGKADKEGNPRLSVFVGNLDFASKEEDLRVFFEGVVSAEKGPPPPAALESDEEEEPALKKPRTWVTRVRIVRDKETQLGKGFAYVQFSVSDLFSSHDPMTHSKRLCVFICRTGSA